MSTRANQPPGRPPKLRDGIRVSDLPTLTVRLPQAVKARLLTLARVTRTPAYEIVEQALGELWTGLPQAVREETDRRGHDEARWEAKRQRPKGEG